MKYCLLPRLDLRVRYGGGWALVTGAQSEVRACYSMELAKSGFNIMYIGEEKEKMEADAKFISEHFKVETKVIDYDFTTLQGEEQAKKLDALLKE